MSPASTNGKSPSDTAARQVNDDENKSQTATIQRIQKYRDNLADYQMLFAQNELTGDVSEAQQHRSYHQLTKGFLRLLKPYLTDYRHEDPEIIIGQRYWEEVELGSFTIDPPAVISRPSRQEMDHALRTGHQQTIQRADPRNSVEPKEYSVRGLRDFDAAEPEWSVEWQVMYGPEVTPAELRSQISDPNVHVQPRATRTEPITIVKTARVPRRIIDETVTQLENFVRDLGMDVDIKAEPYMGEGGAGI